MGANEADSQASGLDTMRLYRHLHRSRDDIGFGLGKIPRLLVNAPKEMCFGNKTIDMS